MVYLYAYACQVWTRKAWMSEVLKPVTINMWGVTSLYCSPLNSVGSYTNYQGNGRAYGKSRLDSDDSEEIPLFLQFPSPRISLKILTSLDYCCRWVTIFFLTQHYEYSLPPRVDELRYLQQQAMRMNRETKTLPLLLHNVCKNTTNSLRKSRQRS